MARKISFVTLLLLVACLPPAVGQKLAVKTNLAQAAATLTPNLGAELRFAPRWTLDISGGYNPWNLDGSKADNDKLVHWVLQPEVRFWTCSAFSGHFLGVHGICSSYNISGHELPMLLGKGSEANRYQGNAFGAGISYGYHWILHPRWSLEFTAGVGYMRLTHDIYDRSKCGWYIGNAKRDYFGPTKLGITLIFMIK